MLANDGEGTYIGFTYILTLITSPSSRKWYQPFTLEQNSEIEAKSTESYDTYMLMHYIGVDIEAI